MRRQAFSSSTLYLPFPPHSNKMHLVSEFILPIFLLWGFALAEVGDQEPGVLDADQSTHPHRSKRSTIFSDEEIQGILDLHNQYRSSVSPEAANMRYMVWDDNLATMAQQWSNRCIYMHGQPSNISPFTSLGQNLWAGTIFDNGTGATKAWYDEVVFYTYNTRACSGVCGHYTQVVWAESYAVGCGRTLCPTLSGFTNNAYMITCNYGPAGNVRGEYPYLSGPSCTLCSAGSGQCYKNQCRPCSDHSEPCECRAFCNNCGVLDAATCTCTCRDGWLGADCNTPCVDTDSRCGVSPGWPQFLCGQEAWSFVDESCPLLCGSCNSSDPNFICDPTPQTTTSPTTKFSTTTKPPTTTRATTTPPRTTTRAATTPPTTDSYTTTSTTTSKSTTETVTKVKTTEAATTQATTIHTSTEPTTTPRRTSRQPSPPVASAEATPSASPTEAPCRLTCANGGVLDTGLCECDCQTNYQGVRCQNVKAQVRYGVRVVIATSRADFPSIRGPLFRIIAQLITNVCNGDYFTLCCPVAGSQKNTAARLNYVGSTHVTIAVGFPEELDSYDFPVIAVMLLITPPTTSDLCSAGLRAVAKRSVVEWMNEYRFKRETDDPPSSYMDQRVVYAAILNNLVDISMAINATILEVTRGVVDETTPLIAPHFTVLLIVGIIAFLAVVVITGTVWFGRKAPCARNSGAPKDVL